MGFNVGDEVLVSGRLFAWSADYLVVELETPLGKIFVLTERGNVRPVEAGVARVAVDEPDPGWVEELRGAVVDEARRAAVTPPRAQRYDQCDETCTADCGHCKGAGRPVTPTPEPPASPSSAASIGPGTDRDAGSTPEAATEAPLVSLDTVWACIDARHDVGQRHDDDGHLATATCHDCRTRYDRHRSPGTPSGLQRATEQVGFVGPLDAGDWRCPVCGNDPIDPTLHGDGCPTIDTPAQFEQPDSQQGDAR